MLPFLTDSAEKNCSGVTQIGTEKVVVVKVDKAGGCAGKIYVYARLL